MTDTMIRSLTVFAISTTLIIGVCSSHAQTTAPITEYFDSDWKTVIDPAKASYYRTIEQNDRGFLVRDYYVSGKIQMEAECMEISPDLVVEGKRALYYENGKLKETGQYHLNDKIGVHKWYYENGQPRKEVSYEGEDVRYLHYWSEAGQDELADGRAEIAESFDDKYYHYSSIRNFLATNRYMIKRSTGDTLYTVVEMQPEYPGGYQQMAFDIKENMTYPKSARKRHITGTVYVAFVVGKDGVVREPEVLRGIDPECDAEALRAISQLNTWKPGMQRKDIPGEKFEPVSVKFVVPIKFGIK
jgi:TonB family protein